MMPMRKKKFWSPLPSIFLMLGVVTLPVMVYITAYSVGHHSMLTNAQKKLDLTLRILQMKSERCLKCEAWVEMLKKGQVTASQAIEAVTAAQKSLRVELDLIKNRNALALQSLKKCEEEREILKDSNKNRGANMNLIKAEDSLRQYETAIAIVNESIIKMEGAENTNVINMSREMWRLQRGADLFTVFMREVEDLESLSSDAAALSKKCSEYITRYSIVFDAGSTGSRVHVFSYNVSQDRRADVADSGTSFLLSLRLNNELFLENHAPLSGFSNVDDAAMSLLPLLDASIKHVPRAMHACTPIELKATAGLRRIGRDRAEATLNAVRRTFRKTTFWLQSELDSVRILEGREEGPLAWLTVNFLLDTFTSKRASATIVDLGGGSTQIVMHPNDSSLLDRHKEFMHVFSVGGKLFELYQHSYEGNGLHAAKEQLLKAVAKAAKANLTSMAVLAGGDVPDPNTPDARGKSAASTAATDVSVLLHAFPCFPKGFVHNESGISNLKGGSDLPSMDGCVELFRQYVVRGHEACGSEFCGFNGVFQPNVTRASAGPLYAFSFYYDRLKPHMKVAEEVITLQDIANITDRVCQSMRRVGVAIDVDNTSMKSGTLKPEMECFELSYLFALLRYGFGFPNEQELHIAKRINGFETSWALGASLVALERQSV